LPLFHRVLQYKWLNSRSQLGHGTVGFKGGILGEFEELSSNSMNTTSASKRKSIFVRVRNPNLEPTSDDAHKQAHESYMPPMSGDGGDMPDIEDKEKEFKFLNYMTILPSQYDNLKKWCDGDFISDFDRIKFNSLIDQKTTLGEIPLEEQPDNLDKSGLELSIGGPFYPGIEITYIASEPGLYDGKAFRINPNLEPGDITQYMAIPWQADFLLCMETWWPTARPDHVKREGDMSRMQWARGSADENFVSNTPPPDYMKMVSEWNKLGFIKPIKVDGKINFIESERSY
ncbi:MAG: LodA/GoxA family CTQ-dependent oxidase, partial [Nitrososphaeraceae archaeon]